MTMLRMLPAFLAAACALAAGPAQVEMKNQWVEYGHGDTKLKAYMAYDDKVTGRRPAVLMIHAREGMTPKTLGLAETWAKLGYVSFAADISATARACCRRMFPKCRHRPRSTPRTAR
jgi:hypothetical protein